MRLMIKRVQREEFEKVKLETKKKEQSFSCGAQTVVREEKKGEPSADADFKFEIGLNQKEP